MAAFQGTATTITQAVVFIFLKKKKRKKEIFFSSPSPLPPTHFGTHDLKRRGGEGKWGGERGESLSITSGKGEGIKLQ